MTAVVIFGDQRILINSPEMYFRWFSAARDAVEVHLASLEIISGVHTGCTG